MTEKPGRARDIYEAYLRGDITPEEAGRRATAWYARRFPTAPGPAPEPDLPPMSGE